MGIIKVSDIKSEAFVKNTMIETFCKEIQDRYKTDELQYYNNVDMQVKKNY